MVPLAAGIAPAKRVIGEKPDVRFDRGVGYGRNRIVLVRGDGDGSSARVVVAATSL